MNKSEEEEQEQQQQRWRNITIWYNISRQLVSSMNM